MPPALIRRMSRACSNAALPIQAAEYAPAEGGVRERSANEALLRLQVVFNEELHDLVDIVVAAEAERLGARGREHPRPAADDRLDCWIGLPADAGMGCLAAGAAQRGCHLPDRDREAGELQRSVGSERLARQAQRVHQPFDYAAR